MYRSNKYLLPINMNSLSLDKFKFHIFLKKKIFDGKIIIFRKNKLILELIKEIEMLSAKLRISRILFERSNFKKKNIEKKIILLQHLLKNNNQIKKKFCSFLNTIGFESQQTFMDKICLRYSNSFGKKGLGILKSLGPHRDTWGSNIFEQINWWFPIHDIESLNSLFIVPCKFSKKITNNSNNWSFKKYKQDPIKINSSPEADKKETKNKVIININKGDIICFSGHHLHGTNHGKTVRINIETRTVSLFDKKKFLIPKNLDSYSKLIKSSWFKNIESGECLSRFY